MSLGGWEFQVLPVEIDEAPLPGEAPQAYVARMACTKARAAAEKAGSDSVVVAADTAVVDRSPGGAAEILGKPGGAAEAEDMLRRLAGRTHQVYSGLAALRERDGRLLERVFSTDVTMRSYTEREIQAYVASGDPLDKAGAYAIQNEAFRPVADLDGCYTNVVGLPLCGVYRLLTEFGLPAIRPLPYACFHDPEAECTFPPEVFYEGRS